MSETLAAIKAGAGALKLVRRFLDGPARNLDNAITEHLLEEVPRILRLLEDRIETISASGCTHEDANTIAYQVFDAQTRTLDSEKRRRLSNVLVNGLCEPQWDKVTHRLMVRFTSELEEEHIARLKEEVRTPEEKSAASAHAMRAWSAPAPKARLSLREQEAKRARERQVEAVEAAIERELLTRGLLEDVPIRRVKLSSTTRRTTARRAFTSNQAVASNEPETVETRRQISLLGVKLLEYLSDPERSAENL